MGANTSLSPFRFPGGKSSFLTAYQPHLDKLMEGSQIFVDVFVGGGSVACYMAQRYPAVKIVMNDADRDIASFWTVIAEGKHFFELSKMILQAPTVKLFKHLRETPPITHVEHAYRAIFFNRCTFSGIAKSGPLGGYEQKSQYKIDCRYNRLELIDKIAKLMDLFKGRLKVIGADFRQVLPQYKEGIYCDPPYYLKGKQLYRHYFTDRDHFDLKALLIGKKFLLSYDKCPVIDKLWQNHHCVDIPTRYSINKGSTQDKGMEQLIMPKEQK